jgi:hypothetical protein
VVSDALLIRDIFWTVFGLLCVCLQVEHCCICGWDASPLRVGGCVVEEGSTSYHLVSTRTCEAAVPFDELYVFLFRHAC